MKHSHFGLLEIPTIPSADFYRDNAGLPAPSQCPTAHFDHDTVSWFSDAFLSVRDSAKAIMEIGVDAFSPNSSGNYTVKSSTQIMLESKRKETLYLGIDIADKSYLNNPDDNIYTLMTNSDNYLEVHNFLVGKGVTELDFLFIDGDHSLNYALIDWNYTEWLKIGGVVVMHDTHYHLGPKIIFECMDTNIFEKQTFGDDRLNWGLGVARRIR